MLRDLDGLTYNDDLGWLPGDENLPVKRETKRLRKMRRKAGPDAEGEICGDGPVLR